MRSPYPSATHLRQRKSERGQVIIFVVIALALFALGIIAFAVDYTNAWSRKQSAQNAGDAACLAAAMDLLYATGNFSTGSDIDCASATTIAPCKYAALNGYDGTTGNSVKITFPTTNVGLPTSGSVVSAAGVVDNAFVQVEVIDQVPLTFARLITSSTTANARTISNCGLVLANSPIPLLVLNPNKPNTLRLGGTGSVDKIVISGGPQRSIQVNSSDSGAVSAPGNPIVDLTNAGPPGGGGGIFGVYGGPASAPFTLNPSGNYQQKGPISDPLMKLAVPAKPSNAPAKSSVPFGTYGCPDSGGCDWYQPGYYSSQIQVKNATAIFDPGIYYVDGGLALDSNSCVRPSAHASSSPNDIGGTMFYFNSGTITVKSDSGAKCPNNWDPLAKSGTGQLQFGVACTAASEVPANITSHTITGNVLLGPCTGTYGDPLGTDDPIGEQRGVVFFQNRSNTGVQPSWGGNGNSAIVGTLYFHNCNSADGSGLGTRCNASTGFTDTFSLSGTPGSTSYVAGEIITDYLDMGGTPNLDMYLNPNALYYVLKATLLPSYQ